MRIAHGHGQRRVTENLLQGENVPALHDEVASERMPQNMRRLASRQRQTRRRVSEDDIKAIVDLVPEYALWLVSGKVAPECGQTSPEYDAAHSKLPNQNAG